MSKSKLRITLDDTVPKGLDEIPNKSDPVPSELKTVKNEPLPDAGKLTFEQKAGKFFRSLFKWSKSAAETIKKLPEAAKDIKYGAIFLAIAVVLMLVLFLVVKIF